MTTLTINDKNYNAKLSMAAVKRACRTLGAADVTEALNKGYAGMAALVYEAIKSGDNKDFDITQDQFEEMVDMRTLPPLFTQVTADAFPDVTPVDNPTEEAADPNVPQ